MKWTTQFLGRSVDSFLKFSNKSHHLAILVDVQSKSQMAARKGMIKKRRKDLHILSEIQVIFFISSSSFSLLPQHPYQFSLSLHESYNAICGNLVTSPSGQTQCRAQVLGSGCYQAVPRRNRNVIVPLLIKRTRNLLQEDMPYIFKVWENYRAWGHRFTSDFYSSVDQMNQKFFERIRLQTKHKQ